MLKNMAIRTKLLTIVSITVAALLIVTILSLVTINGIFNKVKTSIFDELFWSMSMILNADRDMYQAYVAILEIAIYKKTVKNMINHFRIMKKI